MAIKPHSECEEAAADQLNLVVQTVDLEGAHKSLLEQVVQAQSWCCQAAGLGAAASTEDLEVVPAPLAALTAMTVISFLLRP